MLCTKKPGSYLSVSLIAVCKTISNSQQHGQISAKQPLRRHHQTSPKCIPHPLWRYHTSWKYPCQCKPSLGSLVRPVLGKAVRNLFKNTARWFLGNMFEKHCKLSPRNAGQSPIVPSTPCFCKESCWSSKFLPFSSSSIEASHVFLSYGVNEKTLEKEKAAWAPTCINWSQA